MSKLTQSPFTVLVDSAESHPFTFQGIRADQRHGGQVIEIASRHESLGRHPHSLGDYSAEGLVGVAHIERKSMEDAWGTVLGWESPAERAKHKTGRRDRFKKELENLAKIPCGVVVVEATLGDCIRHCPSWGKKPRHENAKIFSRSVSAFMQDYKTPWVFCDSRRHAEIVTYRWLFRAWEKRVAA